MASKKKAKKRAVGKASKKAVAKPSSKKAARPQRKQPETLRMRAVTPSFTVNDIAKSLAWYRDVLGFVVRDRWEHDGKLAGAELGAGGTVFMIGQDDWKKGRDRVKGEGFRVYCRTGQDVDRLAAQIKARGGALSQEPADQPWGMRDFSLVDPDGFKITIGSDLKKR